MSRYPLKEIGGYDLYEFLDKVSYNIKSTMSIHFKQPSDITENLVCAIRVCNENDECLIDISEEDIALLDRGFGYYSIQNQEELERIQAITKKKTDDLLLKYVLKVKFKGFEVVTIVLNKNRTAYEWAKVYKEIVLNGQDDPNVACYECFHLFAPYSLTEFCQDILERIDKAFL